MRVDDGLSRRARQEARQPSNLAEGTTGELRANRANIEIGVIVYPDSATQFHGSDQSKKICMPGRKKNYESDNKKEVDATD